MGGGGGMQRLRRGKWVCGNRGADVVTRVGGSWWVLSRACGVGTHILTSVQVSRGGMRATNA